MINNFIDFILHIDKHLNLLIQTYNSWTYLILFVIIFCETGLVFTPFLPGDSLIFAAGTFAALGAFKIELLILVLCVAAVLGDTINYKIGKSFGKKLIEKGNEKFIKKEHIEKTQSFYEKHGAKTIIIARFVPIVRTFAPFVAGIGEMKYSKFLFYNFIGGTSWVIFFSLIGYFFGNMPIIKRNFTFVIFAIIFISILPGVIEYFRNTLKKSANE